LYQENLQYFQIIVATIFFSISLSKMRQLPLGILAFRLRTSQVPSNM